MGFFSFVGDIVSGAADLVGDVIETGAKVVGGAVSLVGDAADAIGWKGVGNVLHTAGDCVSTVGKWANEGWDAIGKGAKWLYDKAEEAERAVGNFLTGGLYGQIMDGMDDAAAKVWGWLSGRDPSQHELYLNFEKVEQVTTEINNIAVTQVGNAEDAFNEALNRLNKVHGLADYVGTVDPAKYTGVFESITQTVSAIGGGITEKAEAIKKYEESSALEKFGSTLTMGLCKVGEGILSVVEDLGDGVVSLAGFVGGALGAKDFQEGCAKFVKSEWSHDAFNFYYNSEFAKSSAFTEDSKLAGGLKIVGKTAGYLFAGGVMAGTGAASAVGAAVHASTTTVGATMVAGLSGLGSGTESGLNSGKSFNAAFGQGVITGTASAALAFGAGKLSEGVAAKNYLKANGQKDASLKDGFSYLKGKAVEGTERYKEGLKEATKKGIENGGGAKYAKAWSKVNNQYTIDLGDGQSLQGYNDIFTSAGKKTKDMLNIKDLAKMDDKIAKNLLKSQADDIGANVLKESKDEIAEKGAQSTISKTTQEAKRLPGQSADEVASESFNGEAQDMASKYLPTNSGTKTGNKLVEKYLSQGSSSTAESALNVVKGFGNSATSSFGSSLSATSQVVNSIRHESSQTSAINTAVKTQSTAPIVNAATQTVQATATTPVNVSHIPGVERTTLPPQIGNSNTTQTTQRPTSSVTPKVVSSIPTVAAGAASGVANAATSVGSNLANSANNAAASLSNLTGNWKDTAYTPKDMSIGANTQQPTTVAPGKVSVTPVPGQNGKTTSNVPITYHGGGEYDENGYTGDKNTSIAASIAGLTDNTDQLIDEIMGGKTNKIPISNKPIKANNTGADVTIPIAAGLTTAAAAGLGAKAYSDYKKAGIDEEEEEFEDEYEEFDNDGIIVDGWTDDDVIEEMKNDENGEKEFINIDKQDDDEYYRISENPLPITNDGEESFA